MRESQSIAGTRNSSSSTNSTLSRRAINKSTTFGGAPTSPDLLSLTKERWQFNFLCEHCLVLFEPFEKIIASEHLVPCSFSLF